MCILLSVGCFKQKEEKNNIFLLKFTIMMLDLIVCLCCSLSLSVSLSRIKLLDYCRRHILIKEIKLTMEHLGILNMEAELWALSVHSVRGIDKTSFFLLIISVNWLHLTHNFILYHLQFAFYLACGIVSESCWLKWCVWSRASYKSCLDSLLWPLKHLSAACSSIMFKRFRKKLTVGPYGIVQSFIACKLHLILSSNYNRLIEYSFLDFHSYPLSCALA